MSVLQPALLITAVTTAALAGGIVGEPCRCGHDVDAHEHFRPGRDCATCDCRDFRAARKRAHA